MCSIKQSIVNKNESSDNTMWKEVSYDKAMLEKKWEKDIVHEKIVTLPPY